MREKEIREREEKRENGVETRDKGSWKGREKVGERVKIERERKGGKCGGRGGKESQ